MHFRAGHLWAGAACALTLTLVACAPEPSETSEPTTPTPTVETPTPEPTTEPTADPEVSLPTCEDFRESAFMSEEFLGGQSEVSEDSAEPIRWMDELGPAALTTFTATETRRACDWTTPQNGAGALVAVLDDDKRDTLVRALEDSDYVPSDADDLSFGWPAENIEQGVEPQIWQGFFGSVWVASNGEALGRDLVATLTETRPDLVG